MTLQIEDYRSALPIKPWQIGTRWGTRYITIHYNGPAVPSFGYPLGERSQLIADARYHMRLGAFGVPSGADGIQYHYAVLSDGAALLLRRPEAYLWHAGNAEANRYSLAIHLPLGGLQQATARQLAGLWRLVDHLRSVYSIAAHNVKGHLEWSDTACPGTYLMQQIKQYRDTHKPYQYFMTTMNANCRQGPSVNFPIAAVTPMGTRFAVDTIIENGGDVLGEKAWVHRADHLGFYSLAVVKPVA
jgi:hypothetical protein